MIYIGVILTLAILIMMEWCYIAMAHKAGMWEQRTHYEHKHRIPVGGGVIFVLAPLAALIAGGAHTDAGLFYYALLAMAAVAFIDDRRGLSPVLRLAVQIVAAVVAYLPLAATQPLLYCCAIVFSVGYINSSNFMDGSNGMLAYYSMAALLTLAALHCGPSNYFIALGVLVLAIIAFSIFNCRKEAAVFAGDVGSVTAGFFIAYGILLCLPQYSSAPIIVVLFLIDTFFTFLERLFRGERVMQAHKQHLYQRLIAGGTSQLVVARVYAGTQFAINILWLLTPDNYKNLMAIGTTILLSFIYFAVRKRYSSFS